MNRIIDRIRKLLRLSQSANPHEAALAAQRVQQMLSEYNLTMDSIGCDAEVIRGVGGLEASVD